MNSIPCKICASPSPLFTTVDASKHCNSQIDPPLPQSGVAVNYYKCQYCGFIFTNYIDEYTTNELLDHIYNNDYIKFDPLYPKIRPENNARFLAHIVNDAWPAGSLPRVLDYGAGNGMLSTLLKDRFPVENYDALNPLFDTLPTATFDIVFCAEVVEHVPTPETLFNDWAQLMTSDGCVIFSTQVPPANIDTLRGEWWYMGPRNGHVSLFSRKSLQTICANHGLHYESLNDEWHFACRNPHHRIDIDVLRDIVAGLPQGFILV
jgi:Methyltransferase domain